MSETPLSPSDIWQTSHTRQTHAFSHHRSRSLSLLSGVLLSAGALSAWAGSVSIGVVSNGLIVDSVYVAADLATEQGLDVRVVEFSDWVLPNTAVLNKDVDINYFQHEPFLQDAQEARGFELVPLAYGIEGLIGVYSQHADSFDDLEAGSTIAIPDDPVNQGRGLLLLEQAGLISLPEGSDYRVSLHDIVDNPLELRFVELPGPQLPRAFHDTDAIVSFPHFIKASGVTDPADALIFDDDDSHIFAWRFVVHPDNVDDENIHRFISIYQNAPEVQQSLLDSFGDERLYKLAWLNFPLIGEQWIGEQ